MKTFAAAALLIITRVAVRGFSSQSSSSSVVPPYDSISSSTRNGNMASGSAKNAKRLVLHWFRHGDLRVHDNPALVHSTQNADYCIPIFCFDKNIFGNSVQTPSGSVKCGPRRAKFITESVADLRQHLGGSLVVCHGEPGKVFDRLLHNMKGSKLDISIVCQEEVVKEEKDQVKSVREALKKHRPQSTLQTIWGSTMYDLKDLPYESSLSDMPDTFTPFRNKVEKKCFIGKPLPPPRNITLPEKDSKEYSAIVDGLQYMPTLEDLGYAKDQVEFAGTQDPRCVLSFVGGETAALARVKDYIWIKDLLKSYFDTRNGMLGADYSTKFSPWLAHGCLSPRLIAKECQDYENQRVANKSTYWVVFELLWRDFCKFFAYKHGDSIFFPGGTIGREKKWSSHLQNLEAWKHGRTGYPLVDANMREMAATGFMSNRGRQNVASFLAIDMNHDWRCGADWFESHLLDYDVYSNWVNWCSAAGMTGGRLNRFNIVKQSKDYDKEGHYVRHWLPELKDVPIEFVHETWKMTQFQQSEFNCRLGVEYPNPIVPPSKPQHSGGGKGNDRNKQKQRNLNKNRNANHHQKYEMKSLKQGSYKMQ